MSDKLSIELTAKIDGLRDAFNQAIRETTKYDKETRAALSSVDKGFATLANDVDAAMNKTVSSTNRASSQISKNLAQAAQATAAGGKAISVGSNQAAFALTNLGRVAQDAPFGFMGIQNNLNPLLESFQRLKVETGSSSAALKALGSSLIGPAGLGVALSLVSSAVLFYQQYQQKANKTLENAKKVTDDYVNSLDQLSQVQVRGAQNAQRELTELSTLYKVSQNTTISLKQRKDAVDELQSQYPSYFANLKDETILNGGAKSAYDSLTTSIIATARARAAQDLITKNSSKKLENEQKIIDLQSESDKLAIKSAKLRKGADDDIGAQRDFALNKAVGAESQRLKIYEQQNALKKESSELDSKNLKLTEAITDQVKKGADLAGKVGGIRKEAKKKDVTSRNILGEGSFNEIGLPDKPINIDVIVKPLKQARTESEYALSLLRADFNYTNDEIASFITDYGISAEELLSITSQLNTNLSDILNNGLVNTFSEIGSAIGSAFADGSNVAEAAGKALLSTMGGVLVQLGELAISTGVGIAAVKTALKTLNPVVAIGAGVALIALGSIFKSKAAAIGGGKSSSSTEQSRSIPAFASGVQNFRGGMAIVGERGPEIVNLPTGASVIPTGRTERMLSGGGQSNVFIDGALEVGLDKLYVRLQQTGKKLNRLG